MHFAIAFGVACLLVVGLDALVAVTLRLLATFTKTILQIALRRCVWTNGIMPKAEGQPTCLTHAERIAWYYSMQATTFRRVRDVQAGLDLDLGLMMMAIVKGGDILVDTKNGLNYRFQFSIKNLAITFFLIFSLLCIYKWFLETFGHEIQVINNSSLDVPVVTLEVWNKKFVVFDIPANSQKSISLLSGSSESDLQVTVERTGRPNLYKREGYVYSGIPSQLWKVHVNDDSIKITESFKYNQGVTVPED